MSVEFDLTCIKLAGEKLVGLMQQYRTFGVFKGLPKNAEKAEPALVKEDDMWYLKIDNFLYSLNCVSKGISLVEHLVPSGSYDFYKMKAVNKDTGKEEYLLIIYKEKYSIIIAPLLRVR